jgi:beta-glucosidase
VNDSSRNLPLTGNLTVATTMSGNAVAPGAGTTAGTQGNSTLTVANPYGMSSPVHAQVNWTFAQPASGLTYTATGLPSGLSISSAGVISGAATTHGTYTVTVTATNTTGASGSATFVWTVS